MMAYINCKRNKDIVHIDSAGNHPITLTIQQAGKLHSELTKILEEATVNHDIKEKL